MECTATDGPISSRDMSELCGHKRKQRDAMEVDQHESPYRSGAVNVRHATHGSENASDKQTSVMNYGRGYFKGTHMPVDGWFQPCNLCRNWTGYSIRHNDIDVPICRRCKPSFAARVQQLQQRQKQLAEQHAVAKQQLAVQQAALMLEQRQQQQQLQLQQPGALQVVQQAMLAATSCLVPGPCLMKPAPAAASLAAGSHCSLEQAEAVRISYTYSHAAATAGQQTPSVPFATAKAASPAAAAAPHQSAHVQPATTARATNTSCGSSCSNCSGSSTSSTELCKALSARLGMVTPAAAEVELVALRQRIQQATSSLMVQQAVSSFMIAQQGQAKQKVEQQLQTLRDAHPRRQTESACATGERAEVPCEGSITP